MIKSIFTNFSVRFIGAIFNFAILLITAHMLGADIRGEIVIIALGVNLIHLISDIATGPALVYLVPRTKLRPLILIGGVWATFISLCGGFLLFQFDLIPGSLALQGKHLEIILLGLLLSFSSLNQNILLGQERIRAYNLTFFVNVILQIHVVLFCIFILHMHSSQPYIDACFVSYGASFIVGFFLVLRKKHVPKLSEKRSLLYVLFSNGFFTQMASITFQLSIRQNFDRLTRLNPGNNVPVGQYSTAIALGEAILIFSGSVAAITMARIANMENPTEAREAALRMSKYSLLITIPAIVLFMLLPAEFYAVLIGKEFGPIKEIFYPLGIGIAVISFCTVFSFYFTGIGKNYMNFFSGMFGFLIALVSAKPLIDTMGIIGAGWSATLAYSGLGLFIFLMFMFVGGNKKSDWKLLIPSRADLKWLGEQYKKIKGN